MLSRIADKVGSGGVWIAALSCTACFPALGSLASAIGLGFLSGFEGLAITVFLPLFTIIALISNVFGWYKNKNFLRGLIGITGPVMVLFALYPLWGYSWGQTTFYTGIILMISVSILDLVKPVKVPVCRL